MLDTVGVAFGGYQSDSSEIIQSLIREIKEPTESTVFGSGLKTSCLYATLANGVMVRYLEFMDRNRLSEEFYSKGVSSIHGHHSESIPPILAVGERQHSTGQEIITAIVVAYELATKFSHSINCVEGVGTLNQLGWKQEIKTPYIMALVAGRLLGLSAEQMANAFAVAGCFSTELGILEVGDDEVSMARNLMFPYGAYRGILGALLARKGFRGPLKVIEGHHGFAEVVLRGGWIWKS
jgi:2-methylcitrate dehydratase